MSEAQEAIVRSYEDWTPRSRALIEQARRVFPGGDTRVSAHYRPYPVFVERGEGCRVVDADDHVYVDFMNNFTSLIHGHANKGITEAIALQARLGTAYAAPTRSQVELAGILVDRIASVEQLRFCSSGSEATLMAIRAARAFTGRQRILKMEGGYHGSYDLAEVSLVPIPDQCGPLERPESLPVDRSIAASALNDAIVAPYNQPELACRLIEEHANELAAVIVEPALASMGMVPATAEFLHALRESSRRFGVLLILDEVITLRVAAGGQQGIVEVAPDLTAMGKVVGGGLPIGAVGGREDVMQLFNPDRSDAIMHASTFSGNPLSMAAGIAGLTQLDPERYAHLARLGGRLRAGFDAAFRAAGVRGQAAGLASLANLHFGDRPLNDSRDTLQGLIAGGSLLRLLHLCMLRRGVFAAGRQMYCVSTPMTEVEIDVATAALGDSLDELRPLIEDEYPHLLL